MKKFDVNVINMYRYEDKPDEFVKLLAKSLAFKLTYTNNNFLRQYLPNMIAEMELIQKILSTDDVDTQKSLISTSSWNIPYVAANAELAWTNIK
jgi:hypothetical protein